MKIWFRVGVDMDITEDEYNVLKSKTIDYSIREQLFTNLLKRAELSGESYAPEIGGLDNKYVNEVDGFEEISFQL